MVGTPETIAHEAARRDDYIELLAAANYVSAGVMEAHSSASANKKVGAYSGKCDSGAWEFIDTEEQLAIDRAKKLFGADYANVLPHSDVQANTAVYRALLKPGDTILGLSLAHGGHLTDKIYHTVRYGLHLQTGEIDYGKLHALARKHMPRIIVACFSEFCRILDFARMRAIADEVGAYLLVDIAHVSGLVAAGLYPNPVRIADVVTTATNKTLRGPLGGVVLARADPELENKINVTVFSIAQGDVSRNAIAAKAVAFKEALDANFITYQCQVITNARAMREIFIERGYQIAVDGTDNHLIVVDLSDKGIAAKDAGEALDRARIAINTIAVPGDLPASGAISGIQIGTSAVTTRGCKVPEVKLIASLMCNVLDHIEDGSTVFRVRKQISQLCRRFPV